MVRPERPHSINQDRLSELRDQGYDSELLLGRLDFNGTEGMRKDLAKLVGKDRVFPEILPTQASGRWSTKNPNLGGFKREFWKKHSGMIHPDQNEWWVEFDWKGIEARIFTAYSGDEEDVALLKGEVLWCGRCGHDHTRGALVDGTAMGRRDSGGRRELQARSSGHSTPPSEDDRSGRNRASRAVSSRIGGIQGDVALEKENVWGSISGTQGGRLDDDYVSVAGKATQGASQESPHGVEGVQGIQSQQYPKSSMGCAACSCQYEAPEVADIHTFTALYYLLQLESLPADWQGSTDVRRIRAKNFRYGLTYGQGPGAILGMPGIEKLGLNRSELVGRARRFLEARPKGVAWKRAIWESCRVDKVARTFMGRRRLLFGPAEDREKDGLAHVISGSVADLMAWCLIEVIKAYPETSLILNKHDGAILAIPNCYDKEPTMLGLKQIVEREWEFALGVKMVFPAEWRTIGI